MSVTQLNLQFSYSDLPYINYDNPKYYNYVYDVSNNKGYMYITGSFLRIIFYLITGFGICKFLFFIIKRRLQVRGVKKRFTVIVDRMNDYVEVIYVTLIDMNFISFYPLISFTVMHVLYLTPDESKLVYMMPSMTVMLGATYAKYVKINELIKDYRLIRASKRTKILEGFSKKEFYNSLTLVIEEWIQVMTIIGMMTLRGLGERCFYIFYLYLFLYSITLFKMIDKLNKLCHFLKFLNMILVFFYSCLVKIIYTGGIIDSSIMNVVLVLIIVIKIIEVIVSTVSLVIRKQKQKLKLKKVDDVVTISEGPVFLGYPRDFFYSIHQSAIQNNMS